MTLRSRLVPRIVTALLAVAVAALPARAQLGSATRDSVIRGILDELDRAYVFPDKASEMRKAITAHQQAGDYERITTGTEFALTLTRDLQAVSHDKHLRVRFGAPPAPAGLPPRGTLAERARDANYGVGEAKMLDGGIGYVEIRSFGFPAEVIREAVTRAMSVVADADALVIDVRSNGGGAPEAVRLWSSYLFGPEPVHLNSLYFRPTNTTEHFYTLRDVEGKRYGPSKPVYVLTSRRTFSAAEEFTYNLQSLKRATIVGDTTGGGAHPGGMRPLVADFAVFVPSGRAINPITKTNWEGTGVRPAIAVPSDSALSAALAEIRKKKAM